MSYTKQNFKSGDILYADQLNHIETGIENIDNSSAKKNNISYSNIPQYCGTWVDNKPIYRRVYVITSGIAKGNTIKVADKPSNMALLVRGFGISEGSSDVKHSMTNTDITVYVSDDGVFAVNNFTGYAERLYIIIEYTVNDSVERSN